MFKSRSASQGAAAAPESLEAVRRRARHRLIGAAVLVLAGVVGFPLLFDAQPRPIAVDVPIDIPSRNNARPLPAPSAVTAPATSPDAGSGAPANQASAGAPKPGVHTLDSLGEREQVVASTRPAVPPPAAAPAVTKAEAAPAPESKAEPQTESKPAPKVEVKPEPRSEPKSATSTGGAPTEAARAQSLLEGQAADRIVVQVGAYADSRRAQEVRLTLERAGLKTYTHVAKTPEGERIRVRLGPFASRAEADKAAAKVKALGLPSAVLTL